MKVQIKDYNEFSTFQHLVGTTREVIETVTLYKVKDNDGIPYYVRAEYCDVVEK